MFNIQTELFITNAIYFVVCVCDVCVYAFVFNYTIYRTSINVCLTVSIWLISILILYLWWYDEKKSNLFLFSFELKMEHTVHTGKFEEEEEDRKQNWNEISISNGATKRMNETKSGFFD